MSSAVLPSKPWNPRGITRGLRNYETVGRACQELESVSLLRSPRFRISARLRWSADRGLPGSLGRSCLGHLTPGRCSANGASLGEPFGSWLNRAQRLSSERTVRFSHNIRPLQGFKEIYQWESRRAGQSDVSIALGNRVTESFVFVRGMAVALALALEDLELIPSVCNSFARCTFKGEIFSKLIRRL